MDDVLLLCMLDMQYALTSVRYWETSFEGKLFLAVSRIIWLPLKTLPVHLFLFICTLFEKTRLFPVIQQRLVRIDMCGEYSPNTALIPWTFVILRNVYLNINKSEGYFILLDTK